MLTTMTDEDDDGDDHADDGDTDDDGDDDAGDDDEDVQDDVDSLADAAPPTLWGGSKKEKQSLRNDFWVILGFQLLGISLGAVGRSRLCFLASGASWEPLGGLLVPPQVFSGPSARNVHSGFPSGPPLRVVLGPSWVVLEAAVAVLGPSWAVLEPSWGPLGLSWVDLKGILGRCGRRESPWGECAKIIRFP
eukprot:7213480-Pyramimonas_sp.AAC.1